MFRTLFLALLMVTCIVAVPRAQGGAVKPPASTPSGSPLNLNTATSAQLEALPGIGKATADRIIEFRTKNGGFKKSEDLMNVRGVGEKAFLKLKPLITVAAAKGDKTPPE